MLYLIAILKNIMKNPSSYLSLFTERIKIFQNGGKLEFSLLDLGLCKITHHLIQEYQMTTNDVLKQIIKKELRKSVHLILSYMMPINFQKMNFTVFPIEVEGEILRTSDKISYSEGDLQVVFLLLKIAILLKDDKLYFLSNITGSVSIYKEKINKDMISSCDFEHGTIGIALLYQTMYLLTNIKFYSVQADYWYSKSLKILALNPRGQELETVRAFQAFENPENSAWRKFFFLEYD